MLERTRVLLDPYATYCCSLLRKSYEQYMWAAFEAELLSFISLMSYFTDAWKAERGNSVSEPKVLHILSRQNCRIVPSVLTHFYLCLSFINWNGYSSQSGRWEFYRSAFIYNFCVLVLFFFLGSKVYIFFSVIVNYVINGQMISHHKQNYFCSLSSSVWILKRKAGCLHASATRISTMSIIFAHHTKKSVCRCIPAELLAYRLTLLA